MFYKFTVIDNSDVRTHKKHNESTVCWHVITLYLLFIVYIGPDDGVINAKHTAHVNERGYVLNDDSTFFPLLHYNTMGFVLLTVWHREFYI